MSANLQNIPLFPALYGACGGLVTSFSMGSSEGAKSMGYLSNGRYYRKLSAAILAVGFFICVKNGYRIAQKKGDNHIYVMKKTDVISLPLLGAVASCLGGFYGAEDFSPRLLRKVLKISALGAETSAGVAFLCYEGWVIGYIIGRKGLFSINYRSFPDQESLVRSVEK